MEDAPPAYTEHVHCISYTKMDIELGDLSKKKKLEAEAGEVEKEVDPWELPEFQDTGKPWKEMTAKEKMGHTLLTLLKLACFLGFLYLFFCSLDLLSSAFRLLGGRAAGQAFSKNKILSNPIAGLMVGVLATVLLQSSSTTTSIVVAMVGAELLSVKISIPIIMGANIGTSVTNTIVAHGQITNKADFRRAFAGATVHDMFNWLTVLVLLPIEVASGYLYRLSDSIIKSMHLSTYSQGKTELLKAITEPFTSDIVQVNKDAIKTIAKNEKNSEHVRLLKDCCKSTNVYNSTLNSTDKVCLEKCKYLFKDTGLSETVVGVVLLIIALVLLCICLFAIVKILNSILKGNIRKGIKKFVNYEFPGKMAYFTGYLAVVIGCGFTILVQSSSIFTSALTPLVGVGVVSIDRMYPLTLGANIGTTTTSILAALAQDADHMSKPLQVAICHLFFNLSGILLFYPIPYLRFPIPLAKYLGLETEKYRWFAILYLVSMFFLLPAFVFGLSLVDWRVMVCTLVPMATILLIVLILKFCQKKCPECLPKKLRTFKFLPLGLRSLEPYDKIISTLNCCKRCKGCSGCRRNKV